MTEALRKSIESIRNLSPQLNSVTDDAAKVVQSVEKFLNDECQLGLAVFHDYAFDIENFEPTTGNPFATRSIGYARTGGRFRIVIVTASPSRVGDAEHDIPPRDATVESIAWSESARGEKLSAFPYLPKLLEAIATEVERQIKSAREAAGAAATILESLSGKPTSEGAVDRMKIARVAKGALNVDPRCIGPLTSR